MVLSKTCQYQSVHADAIFSQFTKETQGFPQGVRWRMGQVPQSRDKTKLKWGHFWQEVGNREGRIILGKYGSEYNFNCIAIFWWTSFQRAFSSKSWFSSIIKCTLQIKFLVSRLPFPICDLWQGERTGAWRKVGDAIYCWRRDKRRGDMQQKERGFSRFYA